MLDELEKQSTGGNVTTTFRFYNPEVADEDDVGEYDEQRYYDAITSFRDDYGPGIKKMIGEYMYAVDELRNGNEEPFEALVQELRE